MVGLAGETVRNIVLRDLTIGQEGGDRCAIADRPWWHHPESGCGIPGLGVDILPGLKARGFPVCPH